MGVAMMKQKKIFLLAGEASGDVLGSEFLNYTVKHWPGCEYVFWGGEKMSESLGGQKPQIGLEQLSLMGFIEVLNHLPRILKQERGLKQFLSNWNPDLVVCIDYQAFNMRLARWITNKEFRDNGTKLIQIVSPQFWAWRPGRILKLKKYTDAVFPLLPFESDILNKAGIVAPYFGHPAVNRVSPVNLNGSGWLALLPGSRIQELVSHIPVFYQTALKLGRPFKWVRPLNFDEKDYMLLLKKYSGVDFELRQIVVGVDSLEGASIALVASGTATLETALRGIPHVVGYKTSWLTYFIAKSLIKVDYISLINLLLNKEIVSEFIQKRCNADLICNELKKVLNDHRIQSDAFLELRSKLDLKNNPMISVANYVANNF